MQKSIENTVAMKLHIHNLLILITHNNCLHILTSAQGLPGAKQADG